YGQAIRTAKIQKEAMMLDAGAMRSAASCQRVNATVRFPSSESNGRRAELFGGGAAKLWRDRHVFELGHQCRFGAMDVEDDLQTCLLGDSQEIDRAQPILV